MPRPDLPRTLRLCYVSLSLRCGNIHRRSNRMVFVHIESRNAQSVFGVMRSEFDRRRLPLTKKRGRTRFAGAATRDDMTFVIASHG